MFLIVVVVELMKSHADFVVKIGHRKEVYKKYIKLVA